MFSFEPEILERVKPGALVVAGSRSIGNATKFGEFVVTAAIDRQWCIVIGDASGVDSAVISIAGEWEVPLVVLGCAEVGHLRVDPPQDALWQLIPGGDVRGSCFVIRDEALARLAATADDAGFLGLWNGRSRGTQHTARFCRLEGIAGVLINLKGHNQRWEGVVA